MFVFPFLLGASADLAVHVYIYMYIWHMRPTQIGQDLIDPNEMGGGFQLGTRHDVPEQVESVPFVLWIFGIHTFLVRLETLVYDLFMSAVAQRKKSRRPNR